MKKSLPWIVEAGELVARFQRELSSNDTLTRYAAESGIGVAKATIRNAIDAVQLLNKCYNLAE